MHVLVDSGADVCVADVRVIDKYQLKTKGCQILRSDRDVLHTADGTDMSVTMMIVFPMTIGCHKNIVRFYVVNNLHVDFILGLDWLRNNDALIDFSNNSLQLRKRKFLFSTDNVTVPPYSEHIVVARIRGDDLPRGVTGLTCGLQSHSSNLLIGKSLDNVNNNRVRVRCLNATNEPIEIKRNDKIGQFKCFVSGDSLCSLEDNRSKTQGTHELFRPSTKIKIADDELSEADKQALCDLVDSYADVFVGPDGKLGKCGLIKHKIELTDTTPVRRRAYRLDPAKQRIMEQKLGELLEQGIIEESTSPWSAPCLLLAKKNGTEHRLVTDLRGLNSKTVVMANPLPTTQEALENIGMAKPKWFSTMDLQSGFFQAELDPDSKQYTAFSTHVGLFQYTRLPQGLSNSAQTFQRLMQAVLRGLTWRSCACYIDDIIVFEGQTFHEHLHAIEKVFSRLRQANLKLRANKCQFAKRKIKFLGHVISSEGVFTDEEKITAVKTYPVPTNVKSLRSWMGLCTYYRKFVNNFSKIAAPLNALLKKDTPFVWSSECQKAFEELTQLLTTAPMLKYPDLNKPFKLYTDASGYSLGCCLAQEHNGKEYVVAYGGRSMSDAEKKMAITHKECLSLVYAIKHFDFYLRNVPFTAVVDHQALLSLLGQKEPVGKFARWVAFLQQYNMTLVHRPGAIHCNADALSRREYPETRDVSNEIVAAVSNSVSEPGADEGRVQLDLSDLQAVSMADVVRLQRTDAAYTDIIDYLEHDILPADETRARVVLWESPMFTICDDALYRVYVREGKGPRVQRTGLQLAIPRSLIAVILANAHDSPVSGGHFGISRTIEKVREKYYFPKLCTEITKYVKSCVICCQRKRAAVPTNAAITPMPVPDAPWVRVSTDMLTKLPVCKSGNKHVLVFIDYFTKYVELVAVPDAKSETVARAFVDRVILLHGSPQYLHSDRGTNYLSKLIAETCKLFETHKTQTTSFHPACNGQSERMMSNIVNSLSKMLENKHDVWDTFLPFAQYSYNSTPCLDSTGFSPFFLNHGYHPRMPIDTVLHVPSDSPASAKDFIERTLQDLQTAHQFAEDILLERKESMRQKSETKAHDPKFKVGDVVYIYEPVVVPGNARKLSRLWAGPYFIIQMPSTIHAKLRRVSDSKLVKNKVHINRLKLGLLRSRQPIDLNPPTDVDATEPVVLDVSEIDPHCLTDGQTEMPAYSAAEQATADDVATAVQQATRAANKHKRSKQAARDSATRTSQQHADSQAPQSSQLYAVEKIMRKKYTNNSWHYRIKWLSFSNEHNSWVKFEDLSPQLQQLVTNTHSRITTDKRSQRKK